MIFTIIEVLTLVAGGAILALLCVMVGAFIMFRGRSNAPGPSFLTGTVPKGQVFSVADAMDSPDFPEQTEAEASILKKTERFLKTIGG
jgi:hypothetical protein